MAKGVLIAALDFLTPPETNSTTGTTSSTFPNGNAYRGF